MIWRVNSRVENYLAHFDRLSEGVEPTFWPVESTKPGLKGVTVIAYKQLPDDHLTAVTYGLSLATHPEWVNGSAELCISVRSEDDRWAWAIGHLAETLRGDCPFVYGNTIGFGEQVSRESQMSAFVVYAPSVLDPEYCAIDVSIAGHEGHDIVHLMGMYPIHEVERQWIKENSLKAFWQLGWDPYDTKRPPVV